MLSNIQHPNQIQGLSEKQLSELADELREFIIQTILLHGGHFAANLGVIELTVALLNQYNLNHDAIIWDVGHQSYPYKVLTHRKDKLPSKFNPKRVLDYKY